MIFKYAANISADDLNQRCANTLCTALGIHFTEIGDNYVKATMPVNENTIQPIGLLNGGASMAMIESVGSMAANLVLDREKYVAVGQHISGHHFKPSLKGEVVTATATPLHVGKTSQVWEVVIENNHGKLICKGNITMAVVPLDRFNG